jgi:hypothetical protein
MTAIRNSVAFWNRETFGIELSTGVDEVSLALVALLVVALIITLSVNVPIDYAIARWTVDTLPSDWTSIRNRWEAYHAARTFVSMAGFGSALAAVLWSRKDAAPV